MRVDRMNDSKVLGRGLGMPLPGPQQRPFAATRPTPKHSSVRAAAREEVTEAKSSKGEGSAASGEEIYIGFEKGDYAPRTGRKGRVVKDNPEKYPDRTVLTGGWAGGEMGLKQFVKEAPKGEKKPIDVRRETPSGDGKEIYLGFAKDELELRKSGAKGRFIKDDPRKYPGKEDLGIFPGITGGFAGGEKGLQEFVKSGDVKLKPAGVTEFSPIVIAAVVAGGVTTGAILLNSGVLLSEQALNTSLTNASSQGIVVDEKTKLLLNVALALVAVGTLVLGGRAIVKRFQESAVQLREDALNSGKVALFWIGVLIAALYVLDSQ